VRILHLTDRWSDRGGAFLHHMSIVEALADQGHQVTVAAGGIEAPAPVGPRLIQIEALASRGATSVDIRTLLGQHDVVHLHTLMNPVALEAVQGHPSVATIQDHRVFCPGQGRLKTDGARCLGPSERALCAACFQDLDYADAIWDLTLRRKEALRRIHRVTVLSRYMARELVREGFDAARVSVIPPFPYRLDPAAAPADRPPCVLFVGRLSRAKGVWDAVDAWRGAGLGLPLVFAGTGPERHALESAGFEVLGWLDRSTLSALYRTARVAIFPPRWQEPYGIAGMEAAFMGVAVATWQSGGIEDWHGPVPVQWGDIAGLSRRLRTLALATSESEVQRPPDRDHCMRLLLSQYLNVLDKNLRQSSR
jgi:glycosyltransferase involved in cell wall biosynthesis